MHSKQLLFLITLLAVYLGRVLFGEAIHLAVCSFSHAYANATHSCTSHCASHQPAAPLPCDTPVEEQDTIPESDSPNSPHDSGECSVCLVLAQAHGQATTVEVPVCSEVLPLFIYSPSVLYLPALIAGFQTRAPPESA